MEKQQLTKELEALLAADELQVGQTFRLMQAGITSPKELVANGVGANVGVVGTNKVIIRAILDGEIPNSGIIAKYSWRVVNRLRKNASDLSPELDSYLDDLQKQLLDRSKSAEATPEDVEQILEGAEKLARKAKEITNGVYVYSFPTYLHFGTVEDQEVKWLKIGSTKNSVWQRIVDQSRQTSMPEDPVLIRIYHSDSLSVEDIESKFHNTLERVGHERSSALRTRAGKEWFATTEDALDAIAELMGLHIERDFEF